MLSVHKIAPLWRIVFFVGGSFLLVLAVLGWRDLMIDPPARHAHILEPLFMAIFALIAAGGAFLLWLFFTYDSYTVHLTSDRIRVGRGRWLRWNEIAEVRESFFGQCLELLDRQGRRLAKVEYQIEGAPAVVEFIRGQVPEAEIKPSGQRRFGSRVEAWLVMALLNAVFIAFFVVLWFAAEPEEREWWVGGVFVVFLLVMNLTDRHEVVQLDIAEDALHIRGMVRTRTIARDDIEDVKLELDGDWQGSAHRCVLLLHDGRKISPSPGGDPEVLHADLKHWLQKSRLRPPAPRPVSLVRGDRSGGVATIAFQGLYPAGSQGNEFAEGMIACATEMIAVKDPAAVIFDLSQVEYEWGDAVCGLAFTLYDQTTGAVRPGVVVARGSTAGALQPLFAEDKPFGVLGVTLAGTREEAHQQLMERIRQSGP